MTEAVETVTMSAKRYKSLLRSEDILLRLEAAGVDNWDGYSYAFEGFEDDED